MPITALGKSSALVVIDLQKGIVQMPLAHPVNGVISRTAELARAFRERGLPVVLVNVIARAPGHTDVSLPASNLPPDWTELVAELGQQPNDHLVSKRSWGAFIGTGLDEALRRRNVDQIVLTGVATSIGVESTARSALDYGYNVVLVSDAMTDRDAEAHRNSIEKIFPRLGQVDTTENVLKVLQEMPR